jgi:hypothetical protein
MSESFWKGSFSPNMQKSIGTVTFVPISSMSARDWRWLEFENIRTVAQNRIASLIMSGRLRGFFQVMIAEKAAKNEYFWPASETALAEFATTDNPTFFIHEKETFTESQALEALDSLRAGMVLLPIWTIVAILAVLAGISESEDNTTAYQNVDEATLEEMIDDDRQLLLSTLMMWEMSLEEAEKVLDDLPESDEADEVRDWINDQVAALSEARAVAV